MELLQTANSLFGSLTRVVGWLQNRANPARRQAARILEAFEAHGFERTQINRLLPADLQLTQFELSTADELKKAIKQSHVNWVADFLALNPDWLDGASEQSHTLIYSYKSPGELQAWFREHAPRPDDVAIYKLHLLTSDTSAITTASSGYYAVVLEEVTELGEDHLSRYYHLTQGAHFDHYPSVLAFDADPSSGALSRRNHAPCGLAASKPTQAQSLPRADSPVAVESQATPARSRP